MLKGTAKEYTAQAPYHEEALKRVIFQKQGLEVTLISEGDDTQIIHHYLASDKQWSIIPDEESCFEFFILFKGKMKLQVDQNEFEISEGYRISNRMGKMLLFTAVTDCEFIYVCSKPMFQYYETPAEHAINMAVEIEQKDGYTADHCRRIQELSLLLGKQMKLSAEELSLLHFGAFFHDLGKVKVPIEILNKPGKLTPEEFDEIKLHTIYGAQLVNGMMDHIRDASNIVEQHHERWDGKGYPHGLKGEEIHIGASIVAVVDSYDAMTTDRVYRKGMPKEEALEEIRRNRGTMYRPDVVDAFFEIAGEID